MHCNRFSTILYIISHKGRTIIVLPGGGAILVSQHTILLAQIQQLQPIFFSLFIHANNFFQQKIYEFLRKKLFSCSY